MDDYLNQLKIKNTLKLRQLLMQLPPFAADFFRNIADTTAPLTQIAYAYDLRIFFNYLLQCPEFSHLKMREFSIKDLGEVNFDLIQGYMEYLTLYQTEKAYVQNDAMGKSRKLASLRRFFSFYLKSRRIDFNPTDLVDFPKLRKKAIIRLEPNESAVFLEKIYSGEGLTKRQKLLHKINAKRDIAIITLMLGTGIRVSECVGINTEHLDFDNNSVKVTRKGGDESVLYYGNEVKTALLEYIDTRNKMTPKKGHESALFLSLQNRRMTTRAVQNLVEKYSSVSVTVKKITPHKLRSTYGTNLYRESRDIFLVAEALGHSNVNTTTKHYAQMDEERRKEAASYSVIKTSKT